MKMSSSSALWVLSGLLLSACGGGGDEITNNQTASTESAAQTEDPARTCTAAHAGSCWSALDPCCPGLYRRLDCAHCSSCYMCSYNYGHSCTEDRQCLSNDCDHGTCVHQ